MSDLELVRKMVQPLAAKAGLLSGRVMAMVTEANLGAIYISVGEEGIRNASEAIIRIGKNAETSATALSEH